MIHSFYHSKHLKKSTLHEKFGQKRRWMELFLSVCIALMLISAAVFAVDGYAVAFVNYDLSDLNIAPIENVPEGARLYKAEELTDLNGFSPLEGCTWYLYYEGGGANESFGPKAIPDPPERKGYTFQDWAAQGSADDTIYTVTGNTTFVARYVSDNQYVVNLYYQFENESHTVAAQTSTVSYSWGSEISIPLPDQDSLKGLSPVIQGSNVLNEMLAGDTFSGTLDEAFLQACEDAGYLERDQETGGYQEDENGTIQINIPVTYALTGEVEFKVEYYLQNEEGDQYTLEDEKISSVTGTTHVNLNEMGLVLSYEGFALTAASMEDADSYDVSTDQNSVIKLYYDRNVHYVYYQMNGGNAREPVELRYGQSLPENLTAAPNRQGYTFKDWTWLQEDGTQTEIPTVMPDHDLTLSANWEGAKTTVTLVYWLENANDDSFTVAGQRKIEVISDQTVGYQVNADEPVDVAINRYLTAEEMKQAGISDGAYFTFTWVDSATQEVQGQYGALKTAEGDGSTIINIGYDRNEYTLIFHLGKYENGHYAVSTGGDSDSDNPDNWNSGKTWNYIDDNVTMNMPDGNSYQIGRNNTDDECYQITTKYGAYISDRWPAANDDNSDSASAGANRYYLATWGTHHESGYFDSHTNKNIMGIYPTMSAELIIDPENPEQPHHLVAYWSSRNNTLTHHYMFELVDEVQGQSGTPFSRYDDYSVVAAQGIGGIPGEMQFYEYATQEVRTNEGGEKQNPPQFSNVTYRCGRYSGTDVYFFYTYDGYTATYYENNPNLIDNTSAQVKTVNFHYIAGMNLAQQLEGKGFDYDYTPESSYVSSYGNEYTFGGWYTDANLTFPVNWTEENPVSNVSFYAKWIPPDFTLTLIVPDGKLYQDSLDQFREKGYDVDISTDENGVTTYVVSGIPGGIKATEIVDRRHGALSDYGLTFDYWSYEVNGNKQHYLFDESQYITSDLTLTAQWKTEYTGQYLVRYLTDRDPQNNLGTVTLNGIVYYRLREDEVVTDVAVGSSVTVEAKAIEHYLSSEGQITQTVETPENGETKTCFNFIYTQISGDVTYYVHYVEDTGVNYGRESPPDGVIRLAEDKKITVTADLLEESTIVGETAKVVGGYSPRDSWNVSFTLSAEEDQNHLYIYYVANTHKLSFTVKYFFQQPDGSYDTENPVELHGEDALGKVLYSADLAENYERYFEDTQQLKDRMVGHVLDTAITDAYLLLTGGGENTILVYLKNGTYTLTYDLNDGGDEDFSAVWEDADGFLTGGETIYTQTVVYPNAASVPQTAPERLAYLFTGWNTKPDGSGETYTLNRLDTAPWYQAGGLSENVTLYAQWEQKLVVSFDLRGGNWTDSGNEFYQREDGSWCAYTAQGQIVAQPQDPTLVTAEGVAHSFVGWTTENPDNWTFETEDKRIDLVAFEEYRYRFDQPLTEPVVLYAVWDPDVHTFGVDKTDAEQNDPKRLAGASFTLERLLSSISADGFGGYDFALRTDENGGYLTDASFAVRTLTTGEDGTLVFENLPAGYYRLTETVSPEGYTGLSDPIILYAPYHGQVQICEEENYAGQVTGALTDGTFTVTVQNVSQYSAIIKAPDSIAFVYTAPDYVWNPDLLRYESEDGMQGTWELSASPTDQEAKIAVTNTSEGQHQLKVEVTLSYQENYAFLLPLSNLDGDTGDQTEATTSSKTLSGTLDAGCTAVFSLTLEGTVSPDKTLPSEKTKVGDITVCITKPND